MSKQDFKAMRAAMVSNQLRTNMVSEPRLVAALQSVAREAFVPAERRALAYIDVAVPLGGGRCLSAPLVIARLLLEAAIVPGDRVLVIGAANGYAAALAVALGGDVTALEEDEALLATAHANLGKSAKVVNGPLSAGWRHGAPYEVIIIDGAIDSLPAAIAAQLVEGGRLVTGLIERGVTRLAAGRGVNKAVTLVSFLDLEVPVLPGFAAPVRFQFEEM